MSEWKQCRLGDYIDMNPPETLPKGTIAKKIPMDCIQPYCRDIYNYITTEYNGGTKFRNNDTLMARITPCLENGKTSMVRFLRNNEIAFGSTEFIVFRAKPQLTDPNYVYYLTTSALVREPAIKSMVGSSGRQRVQNDVVENLTIPLPSLPTQRKIASILSALDDKIELNNRMNKNLEEQARAIFDNIELSNFQTKHLSDIADIKYGRNLPQNKLCESGYKVYGGNGVIGNYKDFMYKDPMILISCRGAASGKITTSTPYSYVTNNSLILELKNYELYEFYKWYFLLNQLHNFATGSAQPQITIENIKSIDIPAPHRNHIAQELSILRSYSNSIYQNELNNSHLTALRDTLLPKLMSGELDVSEVRV